MHTRPRGPRHLTAAVGFALLAACGGGGGGSEPGPAPSLPPPTATPSQQTVEQQVAAAVELQQAGKLEEAKAAFAGVIARDPRNVEALYDLGVIHQQQGDTAAALREYGAALTVNPTYVPALFNSATIYADTDAALAITTYRTIVKLQPQAPTAYLNLGLLELQVGQAKQGLDDLETALRQDPALIDRLDPDVAGRLRESRGSATSPPTTAPAAPSASPSP